MLFITLLDRLWRHLPEPSRLQNHCSFVRGLSPCMGVRCSALGYWHFVRCFELDGDWRTNARIEEARESESPRLVEVKCANYPCDEVDNNVMEIASIPIEASTLCFFSQLKVLRAIAVPFYNRRHHLLTTRLIHLPTSSGLEFLCFTKTQLSLKTIYGSSPKNV